MTTGGLVFMLASVAGVLSLAAFCIFRVLSASESGK